ncbi:hypothetical protein [Sphaerothrix gracilis]|uniref:hypothetical protein n=1 Tax=Sphaerothrix gracilis TaxID=3151835 RepID=UPI0031FDFF5C
MGRNLKFGVPAKAKRVPEIMPDEVLDEVIERWLELDCPDRSEIEITIKKKEQPSKDV